MEKKSESFFNGALLLMVAGILVKLIGAVFRIPLGNTVGVDSMGYYDVVYRYYQVLVVVSTSGLPTAISKLVSERITLGDYKGAHRVFKTSGRILFLFGLFATLLMFFGAEPLSAITYRDATEEIAKQALSFKALAPALFFVSLLCSYRGYLQGLQRMGGTAVSQLMEQVGKLIIGLTVATALLPKGPEYAAMGALIGISASELLGLIAILPFYMRQRPMLKARQANQAKGLQHRETFQNISKKLLAIAIPVTLGASIMPLANLVDTAMTIRILTGMGYSVESARGAYSLLASYVNSIINMPAVLTVALAMSLVPAISGFMAKKDVKNVHNASRTGLKMALIISTPCAMGLFVLAAPILAMLYPSLATEELLVAAGLMQTACVGVIFLSLVQTSTALIQGAGKPVIPVINLAFGAALKVISMLILVRIPSVNIQGAAISTVVCYAAACIMDVLYLARYTKLKLPLFDVFLKPLLASAAMGVVVHALYGALSGMGVNKYVITLVPVFVGMLVYGLLFVLLRMFSGEDWAFVPGGRKLRQRLEREGRNG